MPWPWDRGTLPEDDEGEPPGICPEVKPGQETTVVAAKAAGFGSDREYRRAKTVVERGTSDLVADVKT